MTGSTTDNQLDQLVKARWLALGLSQKDLAEVLGGQADGTAKDGIDPGRLRQIADALGLPPERLEDRPGQGKPPGTRMNRCNPCSNCACSGSFASCATITPSAS